MEGILLVDKPTGWTSHDAVAKVRGMIKAQTGQKIKVGHAGTLDPAATGLLIILIGSYTKRAGEFSNLDKIYHAEVTLGATSNTGDREGQITSKNLTRPSKKVVEAVLDSFLGVINQTPHPYSAVKISGQRSYKAARQGQRLQIEPRKVKIYKITDVEYDYPRLSFVVQVSSGTYIRSLAEDIGEKLGTGAYLSALNRSKIGKFSVERAGAIDNIKFSSIIKLNSWPKK